MNADRPPDADAARLREHYEQLRRNALGEFGQAPRWLLFLQEGMCRWLRAVAGVLEPGPTSLPATAPPPASTNTALVGILVDTILDASGPASSGGTR
jgi:hypothetical protein